MDVRTGFFILFLSILGVVSMLLVLPLLPYVVAAALIAFVLYPVHKTLLGRGVSVGTAKYTIGPRTSAGLLTLLTVVIAIFPLLALSVVLFRTVRSFLMDLDESVLLDQIQVIATEVGVGDEILANFELYLQAEIQRYLDQGLNMILQELLVVLNVSARMSVGLLVLIFLLYYFIVDGETLVTWIGNVVPLEDEVREMLQTEIHDVTWAVMKSHVLIALIEGILGGIGLYLLGIPNTVFWSVVMIVLSFLPMIGIWLIWVPAVVYLVVMGEPLNAIVLLLYGLTVLALVDDYFRAILVDRGSGVHRAVVLVGVIGGIYLFGIIGLFIGPVVLAVFKAGLTVFGDIYDVSDGRLDREM